MALAMMTMMLIIMGKENIVTHPVYNYRVKWELCTINLILRHCANLQAKRLWDAYSMSKRGNCK